MTDDDGEIKVTIIDSEQRECLRCKQQTTWNKFEQRQWFGLRKNEYWACARCGKPATEPQ